MVLVLIHSMKTAVCGKRRQRYADRYAGAIGLRGDGDYVCAPRFDSFTREEADAIRRQVRAGLRQGDLDADRTWVVHQDHRH